jgi:glycogen debranching enzyme
MTEEVVRISDTFYILSTSARIDDRTQVLKQGDTFAIFDRFGDIETLGMGEFGIYHQDTRFLSGLVLRLSAQRPLLLSSTIKDDNAIMAVDLMNPDIWQDGELAIPRGTLHIFRSKVLWDSACHERLRLHNYGRTEAVFSLSLAFDADFVDIFEVRGAERERRGCRLPAERSDDMLVLGYKGLDGRVRRTRIAFEPAPKELHETGAAFEFRLPPGGEANVRWAIACEQKETAATHEVQQGDESVGGSLWYDEAARKAVDALDSARAGDPRVFTSNEPFNDWLNRSAADLYMMETSTAWGEYPYAGVPWYSTPFGRDGIITALQYLWYNPSVARGVLTYLAATQADAEIPEQDAQPGKILHETRAGEMAALGEVPFGRYYGTVDATPLYVMLAGAYLERTGDLQLADELWPNVERALSWIDIYGDADNDGFVEYASRGKRGLIHQGWKDSHDSVFHADGTLAHGPIALCEVQGYTFAARRAAATIASALGKTDRARALTLQAEALREHFERTFWCEDLSTYALALDGQKQPCRVRTSNPGHCLYTGMVSAERAYRTAATLTSELAFSGWGIRTVSATESRYNPMSYHNGSVWPHDNSLIAAGFARYGLRDHAAAVLTGLFDASLFFDLHRMPELFCGFRRRPGESPTLYPVSCSPQSWASGACWLLLQACLGLEIRGAERRISFTKPFLPPFLEEIRIQDLVVDDASVDLELIRHDEDVSVNVLRRDGNVGVAVVK